MSTVPGSDEPQQDQSLRAGILTPSGVRLPWLPRSAKAIIGGGILAIAVFCAVAAGWIAPHNPATQDLASALVPPVWVHGGSGAHLLGTDYVGRDVLSRLIYGARVSLVISAGGTSLAMGIGVIVGLIAGYFGRWIDAVIMRLADVQLSLPFLVLVVVLAGVLGPSELTVIVVFGFAAWPVFGRLTRSEVLRLNGSGFVESAEIIGASPAHIARRHLLPNASGTLITVASYQMASMIIWEAGLGFLGLSVPPTTPSWGNMLADGSTYLTVAWWLAVFPGCAVLVTSLGINLLGDALRDYANPATR